MLAAEGVSDAEIGHVWRHTRRGEKYVAVIIDLTPIRCGSGPARLLDMIEGHSKQDDPLYRARRALHTGADLLTTKQTQRLHELFTADEHVQAEATWGIYQRMIAAYRAPEAER